MNIAIVPYSEEILKNPNKWLFYRKLTECYKDTGIIWKIISEYDDWSKIDYFLFYNFYYFWGIDILKKINKMNMRNRIVFCMMEPEAVHYYHAPRYLPFIQKFTDCIITWNKDMIDNELVYFSLFHSWEGQEIKTTEYKPKEFINKKLLCNISGNKYSKLPTELYSERKRVIEYFEKYHQEEFDLYGIGWETCNYKNYKGPCKTKGEVYQNYRFALSLENERNVRGYITEKIMDCIYYGIVPIYQGAEDITEYIPQDCFISYAQFGTVDEMYCFLKQIDEVQYNKYLMAQKKFIMQKGYEEFTVEAWGENVIQAIQKCEFKGGEKTNKIWFMKLFVLHCLYLVLRKFGKL